MYQKQSWSYLAFACTTEILVFTGHSIYHTGTSLHSTEVITSSVLFQFLLNVFFPCSLILVYFFSYFHRIIFWMNRPFSVRQRNDTRKVCLWVKIRILRQLACLNGNLVEPSFYNSKYQVFDYSTLGALFCCSLFLWQAEPYNCCKGWKFC
jgi:hypothetical protein